MTDHRDHAHTPSPEGEGSIANRRWKPSELRPPEDWLPTLKLVWALERLGLSEDDEQKRVQMWRHIDWDRL